LTEGHLQRSLAVPVRPQPRIAKAS
jgi:hypothetical protein